MKVIILIFCREFVAASNRVHFVVRVFTSAGINYKPNIFWEKPPFSTNTHTNTHTRARAYTVGFEIRTLPCQQQQVHGQYMLGAHNLTGRICCESGWRSKCSSSFLLSQCPHIRKGTCRRQTASEMKEPWQPPCVGPAVYMHPHASDWLPRSATANWQFAARAPTQRQRLQFRRCVFNIML